MTIDIKLHAIALEQRRQAGNTSLIVAIKTR